MKIIFTVLFVAALSFQSGCRSTQPVTTGKREIGKWSYRDGQQTSWSGTIYGFDRRPWYGWRETVTPQQFHPDWTIIAKGSDGVLSLDYADGNRITIPFVHGKRHGNLVHTDSTDRAIRIIPFLEGKQGLQQSPAGDLPKAAPEE